MSLDRVAQLLAAASGSVGAARRMYTAAAGQEIARERERLTELGRLLEAYEAELARAATVG